MKSYRSLFLVILFGLGLYSCGDDGISEEQTRGKGGVWLGGILKIQSAEKVDILFPQGGTNKFTRDVTYQIFESLFRFDTKTMETLPNISEELKISPDGLTYVMRIRDSVFFHPNACFKTEERKLTAADVKFSLDFACSGLAINKSGLLLINRIKGAKEYYKNTQTQLTKAGVSGITVSGKNEITIDLVEPFSGFEKVLAHSNLGMIAEEAYEMYGEEITQNPVGTGPFMLKELSEKRIQLERFPNYWKSDKSGNKLPYLAGVQWTYYDNKQNELDDFQNEKTDVVLNIPVEAIGHLLGSLEEAQDGKNVIHKVFSEPSLSVTYLGFANQSKEFSDLRVRKAFNQAIDKDDLINNWLGGEGLPAENGFVPPFDFYPNDAVKKLPFDTLTAQRLLAQAGYPNGQGFPKIQIYVNALKNSQRHKLVQGIRQQILENLGVQLEIKLCSIAERDKAIADGKAKIWAAGWVADYPHPENFLSIFYGQNITSNNSNINPYQYKSQEFDDKLDAASKELDQDKQNELFVQCDQKIVDDAVVLPILTGDLIILVNKRVKNIQPNPMELLDISSIFIRPSR